MALHGDVITKLHFCCGALCQTACCLVVTPIIFRMSLNGVMIFYPYLWETCNFHTSHLALHVTQEQILVLQRRVQWWKSWDLICRPTPLPSCSHHMHIFLPYVWVFTVPTNVNCGLLVNVWLILTVFTHTEAVSWRLKRALLQHLCQTLKNPCWHWVRTQNLCVWRRTREA